MKKINVMKKLTTIVALSTCLLFTGCEKSSDERVDLYNYIEFMDVSEDGSTSSKPADNQIAVILHGDSSVDYRGVIVEGKPYLEIDAVQNYIDDRFYWDKVEGYVMFTDATDIYSISVDGFDLYKNETSETIDYAAAYVEEDTCYVSLEFVGRFVETRYDFYEKTDSSPAILFLHTETEDIQTATAKEDNKMRSGKDLMNSIVADISEGDKVTVLEEGAEWHMVQNAKGYIGYIQTKYYNDLKTETVEVVDNYTGYNHITMDEKVKLVWHQVTNTDANDTIYSLTTDMKGANVISPTWITMTDTEGGIKSLASSSYVDAAHDMGLDVWILADDFSSDENGEKYVGTVLASTTTRRELIDNLVDEVLDSGADGLNIDYEYVSLANGDNYMQFLRELSIECEENQIVLSVDNYIPTEWSAYYDMNQQGRLADYVVVMSYDEHTAGSEQAGPVASLPFVQQSVVDTVALVGDSSRVIMGVPFYTRIWEEIPEEFADADDKIIQDTVNGNYALHSEAVSMYTANSRCEEAGAMAAWNEETGTNYVYFEEGNSRYMIWLEDADSIGAKLQVATDNNVGGIGCWKLGLETSDIWDLIEAY